MSIVHILPSWSFKTYFSNAVPSPPRSCKWSFAWLSIWHYHMPATCTICLLLDMTLKISYLGKTAGFVSPPLASVHSLPFHNSFNPIVFCNARDQVPSVCIRKGKIRTSYFLIFLFEDRRFTDTFLNWMFNKHVWTLMWCYLYVNIGCMMCCCHFHIHKVEHIFKEFAGLLNVFSSSCILDVVCHCQYYVEWIVNALSLLWISALWSVVLIKVGNVPQSPQVNI